MSTTNTTELAASSPSSSLLTAAPARTQRRWAVAFGLYAIATNATFTQAVWVVYLATHHYSPFAIGLFETAFHLAKFVAEVPTGIFADLRGRRASLIVSCVLGAGAEMLFLHPTAPLIALSFSVQGIAFAFRGGADSALLWTLAERSGAADRSAWYSRLFSRILLVTIFAQTLGTASGGFLSGVSAALPFLATGLCYAAGIVPLLALPEHRAVATTHESHRPQPLAHLGAGMRAIWGDPLLLALLLLSGLTASILTTVGYYTQLYFASLGFSLAAIGVIIALCVVPDSLGAAITPRLLRVLPRRWLLIIFTLAECAGVLLLSMGQPLLAIIGYVVLLHSGDSVLYPALSTYVNERSPEAQRATVLSLETGLFSAAMIVLFPLFGLGLTHIPFATAYRWTFVALAGGALAIAALVALRGRRRTRENA
ncbi:MAG: putative MFS-type transporter [Ktedonobacterales bacterium]|jgi:MFS family permease|nr:MAG: putative MFS-type transporter [Ktedonobacterales bacterium]